MYTLTATEEKEYYATLKKGEVLTPAEKRHLTKVIEHVLSYIVDLKTICLNSHQQPNGYNYYMGEIITTRRLNEAIKDYNKLNEIRGTANRIPLVKSLPQNINH